ncbi:putative phagocytic receptor 1b-like, partial [Trifolium medium]|nr:putative phagocytic receptor 1b-like [Trifolium medium]
RPSATKRYPKEIQQLPWYRRTPVQMFIGGFVPFSAIVLQLHQVSVLCGGSTAIFMFGYGIYFYARSRMSGFLQLSFFIGYNACICYAFFLIFGAISFRVSLLFVHHIYHNVKRE